VFLNKLKILILSCLLAQAAFALSDAGDFLIIPSAEVLDAQAFQVRGTVGYNYSELPFVSSFRFGVFNSLELGVQFGSNVSLDIKNQLRKADGYAPAVAIGARAFAHSPEAYFYGVPKSERNVQTGEFYASFEWESNWWKFLGGVSAFPYQDANSVAPFWGVAQNIGTPKFLLLYEGFFRHGIFHHNAGLSLKPINALQISAGATEFYRYFFTEDGDFGFRRKNENARNGYRSPGIYASIAISSGFGSRVHTLQEDIDSLKSQIETINAMLRNCPCSILDSNAVAAAAAAKRTELEAAMQKEFEEIVKGYFVDDLHLDTLLAKEYHFISKSLETKSFVFNEAQNKNVPAQNRITAIRIMSHFPDSIFIEPLGNIAADALNEVSIAREAALALGVINTSEARDMLALIVNKTDGVVRETIMKILGEL